MNQLESIQSNQKWVTAEYATAARVKQIAKRLNGLGFEFQIVSDGGKLRVLVPADTIHDVVDELSSSKNKTSNSHGMSIKQKRNYRTNVSILLGIVTGSLVGSILSYVLGLPNAFSATVIALSAFFFSAISYSISDALLAK